MSKNKFIRVCVGNMWFSKWEKGEYAFVTLERPTAKKIENNKIEEIDALSCLDINNKKDLEEMAKDHIEYIKSAFGSVSNYINACRGDI